MCFLPTIDLHHSGYYIRMVPRRALNNIQVTISNRIISKLIFCICQQNLVQLGMVPFRLLDPFFLYSWQWLSSFFVFLPFLFPPPKQSFNSLWLQILPGNPVSMSSLSPFPLILFLEKSTTLLCVHLRWLQHLHFYGSKLASFQGPETFCFRHLTFT